MNTQLALWLCVTATLLVFVIELISIKKLKRSVTKTIELETAWENQ